MRLGVLLALGTFLVGATAQAARAQSVERSAKHCELHVWPTSNYGGFFFGAGNIRGFGTGTQFDLVLSPVQQAAEKARAALGSDRQTQVLIDSIRRSGKFDDYEIIAHDPPSQETARSVGVKGEAIGAPGRTIPASGPCYAEFHMTSVAVFRTSLTKMLMTSFLIRYFPEDPAADAIRTIASRPNRGEERKGISNFTFSTSTVTPEESDELAETLKFMADRFLRKKVKP